METEQLTIDDTSTLDRTICAAQRGDRQAFGRLVERYQRTVYATVLRRLDNHAEAQELTQDVFCQAMRKIRQLRDPRCFGGWLRAIADRLAINRAVRRGPQVTGNAETFEAVCVEHRTPLGQILAREQAAQVHLGLDRLCTLDRDTLVAFYFNNHSLVEMSEEFHAPVGTVKRRLHVARKRLAKELAELATA